MVSYTKSDAVFVCPSEPLETYRPGCETGQDIGGKPRLFNGGYLLSSPSLFRQLSQNRVRAPDQFILILDGNSVETQVMSPSVGNAPIDSDQMQTMGLAFRHSGGINALFADGHTKKLTMDFVSQRKHWNVTNLD